MSSIVESLPVRSWPPSTWVLRGLVLVLPASGLLTALPGLPHWSVLTAVVLGSLRWAWRPEDVAGPIVLLLVIGWWWAHGSLGWPLPVAATCLFGAHVSAVLASYGPGALALDRALLRIWLGRAVLAAVPVPLAWFAVRRLDAGAAPDWLWTVSVLVVLGLLLAASLGALADADE